LTIPLITVALFVATTFLMPKRITWIEIFATGGWAVTFASVVDIYLALKLNSYNFFVPKQADWEVLILYAGMYPWYNAIFLNFFPSSSLWKRTLYIYANGGRDSILAVLYFKPIIPKLMSNISVFHLRWGTTKRKFPLR